MSIKIKRFNFIGRPHMLERNTSALYAKSVFYEEVNDIDVYVEDTAEGYSKIYATLLSRLLGLTITSSFPLGDRSKVIARCRENKMVGSKRKSIFLVDGDLFLICGEREVLPDDLVVLDRYCVENLLIDESAFLEIMDDEDARDRETLSADFAYEAWRADTLPKLRRLFITYAMSFYLGGESRLVSRKLKDFIKNDRGEMSDEKVEAARQEIIDSLLMIHDMDKINETYLQLESKVDDSVCFIKKYVSAKNYTLPMLIMRARSTVHVPFRNYAVKVKLAKSCDLSELKPLRDRIFRLLGLAAAPV
ncbi:DUF4435 domain-containing protein [Burkholderia gladioli]|uniref:DUF4435 domain-containing protein n=2 Tax=Burkholderia gladioli TaxID=28095 RepID=UPI0030D1A9BE